jgi:hypothetical protein
MELHKEYGDVVYARMGPYRAFFFFHPDQIREILVEKLEFFPNSGSRCSFFNNGMEKASRHPPIGKGRK